MIEGCKVSPKNEDVYNITSFESLSSFFLRFILRGQKMSDAKRCLDRS